ncbi:MAG: ABC transporter permease [Saprospiraceae bacterium]|nr:ABC transporter permease [Saprospiraceae bacterium]
MNQRLILSIARSLLLARWRQTLVAAIGVTFSIAMFITLLGFMNGLNDMLDNLVLNRTPHIRLFKEIKPNPEQPVNLSGAFSNGYNFIQSVKSSGGRLDIYNSGAVMQAIRADERVLGLAPRVVAPVLYNAGVVDINGIVNGIDVVVETTLFSFNDYIVAGKAIDLKNVPNSILLGKGVADKLQAEIGETVFVTTSRGEQVPLKVVGYFQTGFMDFDKIQSYTSVETAQKLMGKSANYITDIQIKLKDLNQAPAVAKEYAHIFQTDAEDIKAVNAQFETGSFIRSLLSYVVGITLLIVAGFGIYNILNMMIYEKMDSIAILKATGFSGADVRRIFLSIAVSIGFFGGIVGLAIGLVLSLLIDQIPFNTSALPTITTYPVNYDLVYYIIGITFSIITTFFAGYFPARKASKIDPVVIIRGK